MELFDAIRTTRAMRRLDTGRPVEDADLLTIVEAATKGPSGGNLQPTRWLVVTDPEVKRPVGAIYRQCWHDVRGWYVERAERDEGRRKVLRSADHLADHMAEAPAIVVPCSRGSDPGSASSVFGAVQNLCLAATGLGLGTTLTTVHRTREAEVRAVLGVPDEVTTWALIPVGYPLGRWGEAKRRPVREVTYWNHWGEPPAEPPVGA
jgi:nitroreductase